MANIFHDQKLRCVVVAQSNSLRQLFSTVLKELGYPNVSGVSDFKACLEIMETEAVGWVLGPMLDSVGISVLQILELINQQTALHGIKVSVLRDDSDKLLPQAFAHGALSCHRLPSTRENCHDELASMHKLLHETEGDFVRVAAIYLRSYLLEKADHRELRSLLTALLQVYPGDDSYMLELAEACLMAGDDTLGKTLLHQVQITAPACLEQIQAISQRYFGTLHIPGDAKELLAEYFGFHSCLIVDPQTDSAQRLQNVLKRLGFRQVACFADPLEALKWLRQNPKPNLIISQWKLPNLPGPMFLYKLRHRLGLDIPLMILHQSIDERQAPILAEIGVSRLVQEPVTETVLFDDIIWTLKQSTHPSEVQTVKNKLIQASKRRDIAEMNRLRSLYNRLPTLHPGDLLLMDAQIAYDAGCSLHAKKYALEAMLKGADARACMEILSKALMALREFDAAIRCLENVSFITPLNISHLCSLAECHLEKGQEQEFEAKLEQAKKIDEDAPQLLETAAKGAILRSHTDAARKLMSQLKSFKEVLSFMNNRAVTFIRVGNFEEGLALYLKTLDALPEGLIELKTAVQYNLGLGYARANRLEDSLVLLSEAEKSRNMQRQMKSKSLKTRIKAAVSNGKPIVLKTDSPQTELEEQAKLAQMQEIERAISRTKELSRADYCLIRIYVTDIHLAEAEAFLSKRLNFNTRSKLVKDYHKGLVADEAS